jgi:hypothetical protein
MEEAEVNMRRWTAASSFALFLKEKYKRIMQAMRGG